MSWNLVLLPRVDAESGVVQEDGVVDGNWVYDLALGEDRSTGECPCDLHQMRLWEVNEGSEVGGVGS